MAEEQVTAARSTQRAARSTQHALAALGSQAKDLGASGQGGPAGESLTRAAPHTDLGLGPGQRSQRHAAGLLTQGAVTPEWLPFQAIKFVAIHFPATETEAIGSGEMKAASL